MNRKVRSIVALLAILTLAISAPLANTESAIAAPSLDTWEVIPLPATLPLGATLDDVMPSPDGKTLFLSTTDNISRLWRSPVVPPTSTSWLQVAQRPTPSWIIRLSPNYITDTTLYWCDRGGTAIMRSTSGGGSFMLRTAPAPITDVAVENSTTLYCASGIRVYRSTTGAWWWESGVNAQISTIFMLAIAPTYPNLPVPGHVLVGGTSGRASYSTTIPPNPLSFTAFPVLPSGGNVQIAGDKYYASNSTVYAGSSNGRVYRCVVPPPSSWVLINHTIAAVSGLAVHCGDLYAADATPANPSGPLGGVDRTRNPTATAPTWERLINGLPSGRTFNRVPSALRCSDADNGYVALFAIDTANNVLYEYIDTEAKEFFIYSAKFLCGDAVSDNVGVEPASYATAINIHNFLDEEVFLKKRALIANRESDNVGTVSQYIVLPMEPNTAVEIDSVDICTLLGMLFPPPKFIKGFIEIRSPKPLNVIAVYTAKTSGGLSLDVEHISPLEGDR